MDNSRNRKTCPSCGGSGQISFFLGVSRFLLSTEECPECSGLGYLHSDPEREGKEGAGTSPGGGRKRKKKG